MKPETLNLLITCTIKNNLNTGSASVCTQLYIQLTLLLMWLTNNMTRSLNDMHLYKLVSSRKIIDSPEKIKKMTYTVIIQSQGEI